MKEKISSRKSGILMTAFLAVVGIFVLFSPTKVWGQNVGWIVWVKDSPCSGEHDMLSVANDNPTYGGGGSFFYPADQVITGFPCTKITDLLDNTCTFAAAQASMASIKASGAFATIYASHCCRDYSVWKDTQTGKLSVVLGKFGTGGYGSEFVQGDLCCKEAEALAGIPGACSGSTGGGHGGYIGCYNDTSAFDLDGYLERSQTNTPQSCIQTCKQRGFAYAAVQYGQSCLCGNSYGKYGQADNCNYPCTGDASQMCGGYSANSVYSTSSGGTTGKCPPGKIEIMGVCGEPGPTR